MVAVDEGELDFLINAPVSEPTQCGYAIKNLEGELVIEESSTNEIPPSTLDYVICESTTTNIGESMAANTNLSLYPNPVHKVAQLQGLHEGEVWEAHILSIDGQLVHQQRGVGNSALDVSHLPTGVYAVQVKRTNQVVEVLRFVKK